MTETSEHHIAAYPNRSWAVILQQAWTMRLKDRNYNNGNGENSGGNQGRGKGGKKDKDHCWR